MNQVTAPSTWVRGTWKVVAAVASTAAALASVTNVVLNMGGDGSRPTLANLGARWIGLSPRMDSAFAIGDTIHFAATVTDKSGSVLVGARPTWESSDSTIVTVLEDGSAIARAPGLVTVTARIREITARARIVVQPRVAIVRIDGDTGVIVPEQEQTTIRAVALDARGFPIAGRRVSWRSQDSAVAAIDSSGAVSARRPGRAIMVASMDSVRAHVLVTVQPVPASIELVSGAAQRALAGTTLPKPVVVRVLSRGGRPVDGSLVRFRVDALGSVEPGAAVTDSVGRVKVLWTLGPLPGPHALIATIDKVDSAVTVPAEAEPVPANTRVAALRDPLPDVVTATLAAPIGVRVTDSSGRALPNVPVTWVAHDGGRIEPLSARTDSLGDARARWTLGPRAGTQRVRVFVGQNQIIPPTSFTTAARPGLATRVAVVHGAKQKGTVGKPLAERVVLQALDAQGNPVADVAIALTPGEGSVDEKSVTTDSTGRASVVWTLGEDAGNQVLVARLGRKTEPVEITATARAGAPAVVKLERTTTPARRGVPASVRIVAVVTDSFGNAVQKKAVRFVARGGTVTPSRTLTDGTGRISVRWKPAARAASRSVTASVEGTAVQGKLTL